MVVLERITPARVRVGLDQTAYLQEGIELHAEISFSSFTVGPIRPPPIDLQVKAGDVLRIYKKSDILGHKATVDKPAGISCTLPEILQQVQSGHRVFIDDRKIGAIVRSSITKSLKNTDTRKSNKGWKATSVSYVSSCTLSTSN
ncbi:MAG TPA: hypothetical protein VFI73_00445 [Candidatus Nitrosopolaris sp.]|nr:hypothetical protein [Candidatus Nitrosopolaris sp.]